MNIGVDLDDVIYDFTGTLQQWLLFRGYPATCPRISWAEPKEWGLNQEQFIQEIVLSINNGGLYYQGDVVDNAKEVLEKLIATNNITIVTSRANFVELPQKVKLGLYQATLNWLQVNKIPYDNIIYIKDKSELIKKFDIFLDDKYTNYLKLKQTNTISLLFNTLRNQQYNVLERIHSWDEFYEICKGLEYEYFLSRSKIYNGLYKEAAKMGV